MRRKAFKVCDQQTVEGLETSSSILGSRWLDAAEAAILLKRFKRRNRGIPSVGAIRNMVYRGQLHARKIFGRLLFDRYEIEKIIAGSRN